MKKETREKIGIVLGLAFIVFLIGIFIVGLVIKNIVIVGIVGPVLGVYMAGGMLVFFMGRNRH